VFGFTYGNLFRHNCLQIFNFLTQEMNSASSKSNGKFR